MAQENHDASDLIPRPHGSGAWLRATVVRGHALLRGVRPAAFLVVRALFQTMEQALLSLLAEMKSQQLQQQQQQAQWQQEFAKAMVANLQSQRGKNENWDDAGRFKTIKMFTGAAAEWEEWFSKVAGTIKARDPQVHDFLQYIERRVAEKDLLDEKYAEGMAEDCLLDAGEIKSIGSKMHPPS